MGYYKPFGAIEGNLYVGSHAGKHLEAAVRGAKKSIYIICPYIGETYLDLLLQKQHDGVETHGVFHEIKNRKAPLKPSAFAYQPATYLRARGRRNYTLNSNFPRQTTTVDEHGLENQLPALINKVENPLPENAKQRKELKKKSSWQNFFALMCFFVFIALAFVLIATVVEVELPFHVKPLAPILFQISMFALVFTFVFFERANSMQRKATRLPTAELTFSFMADIRFIKRDSADFTHLKLVIIDEEIAFLGSLNFTYSGINSNLESCLSVTDSKTIQQLMELYKEVSDRTPYYTGQEIGEYYYGRYKFGDFPGPGYSK